MDESAHADAGQLAAWEAQQHARHAGIGTVIDAWLAQRRGAERTRETHARKAAASGSARGAWDARTAEHSRARAGQYGHDEDAAEDAEGGDEDDEQEEE